MNISSQTANQVESWQHDKRWAGGRIYDNSTSWVLVSWLFALAWNAIVWSILLVVSNGHDIDAYFWIISIFPAIGLALLLAALFVTIRRIKWGRSVLELETFPAPLGGWLGGTIHVPVPLDTSDGLRLVLQCISRTTIIRTSNDRVTSTQVLWQDEQTLIGRLPRQDSDGCTIPVCFRLPTDAPSTGGSSYNRVFWQLRAHLTTPGANFDSTFSVPVFTASIPDHPPKAEAAAAKLRTAVAPAKQAADTRISFSRDATGRLRLNFPAGRTPGFATFVTFMSLLFIAVGVGMTRVDDTFPRWFFSIVFCTFGGAILIGAALVCFLARSAVIRPDGVELRWRFIGLSHTRQIPATSITGVKFGANITFANKAYFQITLALTGADNTTVAGGLQISDAKWISAEIAKTLGVDSSEQSAIPFDQR